MKTAILLSSCDRYLPMAEVFKDWLDRFWTSHPDVFLCGATRAIPTCESLSFEGDPRDWMNITLQAVEDLISREFSHAYLLLEDHPPFAGCNSDFLNHQLPEWANAVDAVAVNLVGGDQFIRNPGKPEEIHSLQMHHVDKSFPYRFSLHPALWCLSSLRKILKVLLENEGKRSARDFESRTAVELDRVHSEWSQRVWRVQGDSQADTGTWYGQQTWRKVFLGGVNVVRGVLSATGASQQLNKFDQRIAWYYLYYNGPYPMHWSGLLCKGEVNANAMRFLRKTGRREDAKKVISIAKAMK